MEAVILFALWTLMAMLAGAGVLHCFKPWQYHAHTHLHRDWRDPGDDMEDDDEDDDDGDLLRTFMPLEDYEPSEN